MKTANETIYNFKGNKKNLVEEVKKSIEFWEKNGLYVDDIEINYSEDTKFQSDPDEGNLPKKNK